MRQVAYSYLSLRDNSIAPLQSNYVVPKLPKCLMPVSVDTPSKKA
jgi:hypothetical protein